MTLPESGRLIGDRLRARRRGLGLTLAEVAGKAGLTKVFLAQIERDRTAPSAASPVRLCQVPDLPVGSLFAGAAAAVVRAGERAPIAFGSHRIRDFQITPAGSRRLLAIHSTMASQAVTSSGGGGTAHPALRPKAERVPVLRDQVRIEVGAEVREFGPGDALTFDPRNPNTFANASAADTAEALFVPVPPPR